MSVIQVTPSTVEPLSRALRDDDLAPITGAAVKVDVRRASDGFYLDFSINTFVALGAIVGANRYRVLTEVGDTPGLYQGTGLDLGAIVGGVAVGATLLITYYYEGDGFDSDTLSVVAALATQTSVDALPALIAAVPAAVWTVTISGNTTITQAGGMVHLLRAFAINRLEEDEGNPGSLILYKDDGVTAWCTFTLRDQDGNAVVGAAGEVARRSAAVVS